MRLLIAEDERALASLLQKGLEAESHTVDVARDGEEARTMVEGADYDLMVLDLNLPKLDGAEVLARIRARKSEMAVLVVTARQSVEERVRTLDLGADDYLTKPFSFTELSARIRALLRRGARPPLSTLRVGDLEINRVERAVSRAGKLIELAPKEFALLEYLMLNAGRQVTRAMIIDRVWNLAFDPSTNVVDVYINYLRRKIDADTDQKLIRTVRGVGYQIAVAKQNGC